MKQNEGQETARYGRWKADDDDDDDEAKHEGDGDGDCNHDDSCSVILRRPWQLTPHHSLAWRRFVRQAQTDELLEQVGFLSTGGGGSTTGAVLEEEAAPDGAARGRLQDKSVASSSTSSFSTTEAAKSVSSSSGFNREKPSSSSFSSFSASPWSSSSSSLEASSGTPFFSTCRNRSPSLCNFCASARVETDVGHHLLGLACFHNLARNWASQHGADHTECDLPLGALQELHTSNPCDRNGMMRKDVWSKFTTRAQGTPCSWVVHHSFKRRMVWAFLTSLGKFSPCLGVLETR